MAMRKLVLSLFSFVLFSSLNGAVERTQVNLAGQNLLNAAGGTTPDLSISDQQLTSMLANNNSALGTYWGNSFGVKTGGETGIRVSLRFSDQVRRQYVQYWKVRITYTITVNNLAPALVVGQSLNAKQLEVEYDPAAPYADVATEFYADYLKADVNVTLVEFIDQNNVAIPAATHPFPADVYFDVEQATERYYNLSTSGIPQIQPALAFNPASPVNNELALSWSYVQGAESYDVEWLFIDESAVSSNQMWPIALGSVLYPLDWRNASRVNISGHYYNVPLGYPAGLLLFRVRAIGVNIQNFTTRVEGTWSYDVAPGTSVNLSSIATIVYRWAGLDKGMNWQYSASYAEEGLHKEVIAYYDGALYNRQTVSQLNTQGDVVIGETKYDYNGRPGAALLPAPVASTGIHYYTNFNTGYSRSNFDQGSKINAPDPMSTANGTGQFWSQANTTNIGSNAYTPDAQGYPYARTVYLNDGTNRPSVVGGVGQTHRVGGGRETKYYYGTPGSQDELDRLFGSEAGLVSYYKKNMVMDPNGQISVSYIDGSGLVRATALAGNVPANLLAIDGKPAAFQIQGASLLGNNYLSTDNEQIATNTLTVSSPNAVYTFNYNLNGAQHCDNCLDPQVSAGGCVDCKYDLEIRVLNQDGSVYYQGPVLTNISSTATTQTFTLTFAQPGIYQVSKILKPNAAYLAFLEQQYRDEQDCINPQVVVEDCPSCSLACEQQYKRLDAQNNVYYVDDNGQTITASAGLALIAACSTAACGATIPDLCSLRWLAMKDDMSPGGQYFDNLPDIYTPDANGVDVPNVNYDPNLWLTTMVSYSSSPFAFSQLGPGLNNWNDVRQNWNPAWADILVEYHPERCAYGYFCQSTCSKDNSTCSTAVTWQQIRDYEVAMINSINGEYIGQTTNPVLMNPSQVPILNLPGNQQPNQINDNSNYMPGAYQNTTAAYLDPVYRLNCSSASCYDKNQMDEKLKKFLNINGNCSVAGGNFHSIWYVLEDPDNIHGNPNPSLPTAVRDFYWTLHGNPNATPTPTTGIIGTGPGQLTKYQYFRAVYLFYRQLAIYKNYDDYINSSRCSAWRGNNPSGVAIGPQYSSNYFIELSTVSNSSSATPQPLNGPVDDYGFMVYFPPIPSFDAFSSTGNNLPLACAMATPITQVVNGPNGNNGAFALQCREACEGAADEWMSQLTTCLTAVQQAQCRQNLIDICTLYCDGDNPTGSEGNNAGTLFVLAPNGTNQLSSFQEVIDYYNNLNNINNPSLPDCPYIRHGRSYEQALCTCDNLTAFLSSRGYNVNNSAQHAAIVADFNNLFDPVANYTITNIQAWVTACAGPNPSAGSFSTLQAPVLCPATDPNTGIVDFSASVLSECASDMLAEAQMNADVVYQQQLDLAVRNYMQAVQTACMSTVGQRETFTVNYPLDEYYYTLYYYDQAGNLIKTVPPEGVRTLAYASYAYNNPQHNIANVQINPTIGDVKNYRSGSSTTFVYPPHQMVTRYAYNSFNNPIEVQHPDHGTPGVNDGITTMWYDYLGRAVVTQDSRQRGYTTPAYSYVLYDGLGRVNESGQLTTATLMTTTIAFNPTQLTTWINGGTKDQVTKIFYDQAMPGINTDVTAVLTQKNLRNRVASTTWDEKPAVAGLDHATHYSYDIHGNVSALVQEIPTLAALDQDVKLLSYDYDLISGNTKAVHYQSGKADQFHHRYTYDADNRLVSTRTSKDGVLWALDCKQVYYRFGPLARTELGDKKVQGQDYVYTIHGWIKGMNSVVLDDLRDPGVDGDDNTISVGNSTRVHRYFAKDVASFALEYYNGDYQAIRANINNSGASWNANPFSTTNPYGSALVSLYNGNIAGMQTNISQIGLQGMAYRYDQLNRIKSSNAFRDASLNASTNVWSAAAADNGNYAETFTYDLNGNIIKAKRNGNLTGAQQIMDDLTYTYIKNAGNTAVTNKLRRVTELQTTTINNNYTDDIDHQGNANNYGYDKIGNLVSDVAEQIQTIDWLQNGKIRSVKRTATSTKADLDFGYDVSGQRLYKKVRPRTGGTASNEQGWTTTYYVRDAQGNVMATYDQTDATTGTNAYQRTLKLTERHIYGGKRVGATNDDVTTATVNFTTNGTYTNNEYNGVVYGTLTTTPGPGSKINRFLGRVRYELTNHLGNVLAVVSDRKMGVDANNDKVVDYYSAEVMIATDYYVFGAPLPGRKYLSSAGNKYRYGFNGQEKDNEVNGSDGTSYTAEFWQYDSRLGRRWNIDPVVKPWESPYATFSNNPIRFNDPNGDVSGDPQTHTIKKGDTFWDLAKNSNGAYTVDDLIKWNPGIKPTKLREGQKINISDPSKPEDSNENSTSQASVLPQVRYHFIYQSSTPNIYEHTLTALQTHKEWGVLHYNGGGQAAKLNRYHALKNVPLCQTNVFSRDEFPYACTKEGGLPAHVRCVPVNEQNIQRQQLLVLTAGLKENATIIVILVPDSPQREPVPNPSPYLFPFATSSQRFTVPRVRSSPIRTLSPAYSQPVPVLLNPAILDYLFFSKNSSSSTPPM